MTRHVDLPPDLEAYVEARVAAGEYATVDEAVGAAVALLRERYEKRSRLNTMLQEGYRSVREEPTYSVEEAMAEFDLVMLGDTQARDA
jgi:putative addiction module CopG family antidote